MERGEKEQKCLNYIKSKMFMDNPFNGKKYSEVEDVEFMSHFCSYTMSLRDYFFGVTVEEIKQIVNAIRHATPNPKSSQFPDFILPNGFIEHFEVTSSTCIPRGGAEQKIEEAKLNKRVDKELEHLKEEITNEPIPYETKSFHVDGVYPQHSYENLKISFNNGLMHHLQSMDKFTGAKNKKIFLVELDDISLCMIENVYADLKNGVQIGDLRKQQSFQYYRLSRDKEMLNYLYQFKKQIDYIMFICCNGQFEVIGIENIPEILKMLPWDFIIKSAVITQWTHSVYSTTIPCSMNKEEIKDDQT